MAPSASAWTGKNEASTVEAAPEVLEWPETYDGNGGVGISGVQAGSRLARIALTRRIDQYVNFASQHAMNASAWAVLSAAKRRAESSTSRSASGTSSSAIWFQWPGGVTVPAPSAQKSAIARCSGVRVSETS